MTDRTKNPTGIRTRRPTHEPPDDLSTMLASRVVGQPNVIESIVPCVEMFQAGLAPEHRPVGVFLLLGPTGTGKTRTVEALAEALHGSIRNVLKIDCGEFQMEHEVAKLIGAPPGYLGHRETTPMLSQQKLTSVTTDGCLLSIVLFDEIEKAAPSMTRLLLGVLDRGVLRLGDNTSVNFEKSIVFLTSNLGAREMMREITPDFGFQSAAGGGMRENMKKKLQGIALGAVKRKFSPEFVNRIDHVITYKPLDGDSFAAITDHEIRNLQRHINERLGIRRFDLEVPYATRQWLINKGTSPEYGARELKRTIHRHLTQPLASKVARRLIEPMARVRVDVRPEGDGLTLRRPGIADAAPSGNPTVLVVNGNRELLLFLERTIADGGWEAALAESAAGARKAATKKKPNAALIDLDLADANGIVLALELVETVPNLLVTIMTSCKLTAQEEEVCARRNLPVVRKPFLPQDLLNDFRRRLPKAA